MAGNAKELSLEENFEQLDTMIEQLSDKNIGLEEAFSLYEKGMKLLRQCNQQIDRIEKKVKTLNGDGTTDDFSE